MTQAIPIRSNDPKGPTGPHPAHSDDHCHLDAPEFERLRFFHGQGLGAVDLRLEQAFQLNKDRVRNQLLHGWGIVCGLEVEVLPKGECDPCDEGPDPLVLRVHPGAAIDCEGHEILVRRPRDVVVERLLGEKTLKELTEQAATVYLSISFHEELGLPSRPLLSGGCEPVPACEYGRVKETYKLCASTTKPDPGPACEPCCGGCGSDEDHDHGHDDHEDCGCGCGGSCGDDRGLELAAIPNWKPGTEVSTEQLDLTGRRPLGKHLLATITGINWVHGATYTRSAATKLIERGIELTFSRGVQVASLRQGVVELTAAEGGGGSAGEMKYFDGEFAGLPEKDPLTNELRYRSTTGETLQYGDRLMIRVRGDFILDECCRALDADHIGGLVPALPASEKHPQPEHVPDALCSPRPSGNGIEGGEFLSWIFVEDRPRRRRDNDDQGADAHTDEYGSDAS